MDYAALLRDVERRQFPPVVLLHGPEPLLQEDAVTLISRALCPDASSVALDREVLDGREVSADAVARSALTLPFLAPRRLVVVRHAAALPARGNEGLLGYLASPSPATCLLFLATEPLRADRTRKSDHWLLAAVPSDLAVEVAAARGPSLERALQQRARLDGLEVSDEAARLLVQWVGEDLGLLLAEARKAALAAGPDASRVGVSEVRAVVGEHRVGTLFDLLRAIERGDRGRAQTLLDDLLRVGEEPLRILGFLVSEIRTVWSVKDFAERGVSIDQIARRLRRPPQVVEKLVSRTTSLSGQGPGRRLERCWEVERRLKSGGQPRAELALLIADLC